MGPKRESPFLRSASSPSPKKEESSCLRTPCGVWRGAPMRTIGRLVPIGRLHSFCLFGEPMKRKFTVRCAKPLPLDRVAAGTPKKQGSLSYAKQVRVLKDSYRSARSASGDAVASHRRCEGNPSFLRRAIRGSGPRPSACFPPSLLRLAKEELGQLRRSPLPPSIARGNECSHGSYLLREGRGSNQWGRNPWVG